MLPYASPSIDRDALKIAEYRANPVLMVREIFGVDPDLWQIDALEAFASGDIDKQRISLQACVGVGKSAVLSWIAWNFLLCYCDRGEHPKGAVLSMTWDNLKDGLWSELNKWLMRSAFLQMHFEWTQTLIYNKQHKATWFLSARSFSKTANAEEQGRALSGLHAKYMLFLIDEAGSVPVPVGKTAEQAMANTTFSKIILAGNPTTHDGLLYAASKDPSYFKIAITGDPDNPRRSNRIDKVWAQVQIDKYGRMDPWVMSMILGLFPASSIHTLLTDEDFDIAERRSYAASEFTKYEKVLGVDVARFGNDSSVIYPRQGLITHRAIECRNFDGHMLGDRVIGASNNWKGADKINVDGTGGYGSSCIDYLTAKGYTPGEIQFAGQAQNPNRFANRRAEMYWRAAEWVKKRGSLRADPALRREMCATEYSFVGDKIIMMPKEKVKEKLGGQSPDRADGFILTFAFPDQLRMVPSEHIDTFAQRRMASTYDKNVGMASGYDPLKRGKR